MNGPLKLASIDALPEVGIDLVEALAAADQNIADILHADAGVVDEAMNGAEVIGGLLHRVDAVLPLRDVAFDA